MCVWMFPGATSRPTLLQMKQLHGGGHRGLLFFSVNEAEPVSYVHLPLDFIFCGVTVEVFSLFSMEFYSFSPISGGSW